MAEPQVRPPLWACPRCGKKFVMKNTWHSCGRHTVEEFLRDKGPKALALWSRLVEIMETIGPFELVANKTVIGFMVRVRFAGVHSLSERGMTFHFWLKERIESSRFSKVEQLGLRDFVYRLRVSTPEELDDAVVGWLQKAYQVGCQEHPSQQRV